MSAGIAPRPHQVQALADLMATFVVHDRAQLVMACGTGKTLVGRWYAEASEAGTVLVLVPSLSLLAQTLREWRRVHTWPFDALVVCSDPSTSAGAAERLDEGAAPDAPTWSTVRAQVTTDPAAAALFLSRASTRARVVFSTYHSAPVVAAAQARAQAVFDLAICDEAHRLAGAPREEFQVALNPRQIVARRRLFMTATTKVSAGDGTYSMDDPTLFGPVAHTINFGDAIASGLLCDYRVLVLGARGDGVLNDPLVAAPAALLDAIDRHQVKRVITFHSRVARAQGFAAALDGAQTPAGHTLRARHLSGAMPTQQRAASLAWLGAPTSDTDVRVVSNARVLAEGVDVPAVDAVCFADPRSSVIDIIQAVGRVLRPHPGKRVGTIIVPVTLPPDGDDDTELLVSPFALLWSVLRALRSHDERFAGELDQAVRGAIQHGSRGYRPGRVEYQLPDWLDENLLHVRMVQEIGDAWEKHYATTMAWAYAHPGLRLPRATRHLELAIGEWAVKQRQARAAGVLPLERVKRLELVPEWYWDRIEAAWEDTWSLLQAFARAHGSVAENQSGASVFEGLRAAAPQREHLTVWIAAQRQAYRVGTLDRRRAQLLEELPGWTWSPVPADDLAAVDALAQFVEFEKHACVPDRHVEDGVELGRWVWSVRRRKLTDTLHPALEAEIWAATPSRWRVGARTRWQWEKPETQWRLAYSALLSFTRREGHACPATTHREQLADGPVRVGQWVALQRHQHRNGELSQRRVAALEHLAGWQWDGDVGGTREAGAPIDLPPQLRHGSAGALSRGCRCEQCLAARRAKENAWGQRRRQARVSGIDARDVHRHLVQLEAALLKALGDNGSSRRREGLGRSLIARTADVPLAVVRGLCTGEVTTATPAHRLQLLAVTAAMCLSNVSASGSRGRLVQAGAQRVDATETLQLVADLDARGFNRGWIGRELGNSNGLQLTGDTVTAAMAARIRRLHQDVGDLTAPPTAHTKPLPPLRDLLKKRTSAA